MNPVCQDCGAETGQTTGRPSTRCVPCRKAYRRRTHPRGGGPFPERACDWCGISFTPPRRESTTCSKSCYGKHNFRMKQAARGVDRAGRICKNCGGLIDHKLRTDKQYCSAECGYRWNSRRSNIRKMGISPEQFDAMLESQGGTCAIRGCDTTVNTNGRRLHIDHDHDCCPGRWSCGKCIRGLLCDRHNVAAGMLRNNADECDAMGDYLRPVRMTAVA